MRRDRIGRRRVRVAGVVPVVIAVRSALAPVLAPVLAGGLAASLVLPEAVGLGRTRYRPMVVPFRPVLSAVLILLGAGLAVARPTRPAGLAAVAVGVAGTVTSAGNHSAGNHSAGHPGAGDGRAPTGTGTEPGTLRVLSANVLQGRADPEALATCIREHRPDLVVLPEAGDRFRRRLDLRVGGYRSWSSAAGAAADRRTARHPDGPCVTVLVADHLGDVEVRPVDRETVHGWLEVRGGALGAVRLLAVHPVAPYLHRSRRWAAELVLLGRELARDRGTVVAGDLNATLEHAELRAVLRHATAATAVGGVSRVGTWPARRPRWLGIGIDHVLCARGVVPLGAAVVDLPGSDHRAVVVDLRC